MASLKISANSGSSARYSKRGLPCNTGDDGPAGPNGVRKVAPMLVVLRRTQEASQRGHRHVGVAAQGVRQRGEVVAAVAALMENASRDQGPQQSTKSVCVGADGARQPVRRQRPLGESVRNAEVRRRGDRLCCPGVGDHFQYRDRSWDRAPVQSAEVMPGASYRAHDSGGRNLRRCCGHAAYLAIQSLGTGTRPRRSAAMSRAAAFCQLCSERCGTSVTNHCQAWRAVGSSPAAVAFCA
jgi:hypothetical protein